MHVDSAQHAVGSTGNEGIWADAKVFQARARAILTSKLCVISHGHIMFRLQATVCVHAQREFVAMQDLLEYWQNTFDWRAQEALINQTLNHFTLHINTINLHFVHQRSQSRNAIPLILIHGWPGSFLEFTEIIPKLTDPGTSLLPAQLKAWQTYQSGFML